MQKQHLRSLFSDQILRIPDYQRGYAWESKQWNDLLEDLDALAADETQSHYAGTIVTFVPTGEQAAEIFYGNNPFKVADVVDGQQRLTTLLLFLSALIRTLEDQGLDYAEDRSSYLYKANQARLTLANDCQSIFFDLLKTGTVSNQATTQHQKRLLEAYATFLGHIQASLADKGINHLRKLFAAITSKLVFTAYSIESESEIGMTFELMNSRGKGLSTLELLKNYFMHWVSRNLGREADHGTSITKQINDRWKTTYSNVGDCDGTEDQALRITWVLMCSPTPKHWQGYSGFKEDAFFPIRGFDDHGIKSKEAIKQKISSFTDLLASISKHYLAILAPNAQRCFSEEEVIWLEKIRRTGNIANFLPLMVGARIKCEADNDLLKNYVELLQSLERYAYRVFIFEGKRSNAGRSNLFGKAYELHQGNSDIPSIIRQVDGLTLYYAPEDSFKEQVQKPFAWYPSRLLRYTLFEYEIHRLRQDGHQRAPQIQWGDLSDTTIEHIFPQTPEEQSQWLREWNNEDISTWLHDIGNLTLTLDNSSYRNFDFERKKGTAGGTRCYAGSTLRQERDLAAYDSWTPKEVKQRHEAITSWVIERWSVPPTVPVTADENIAEDEEDDS